MEQTIQLKFFISSIFFFLVFLLCINVLKGLTCKALIDIFFFDELQNTTKETKNQGEDPYWLVKESFELKTTKRLQYYVVI